MGRPSKITITAETEYGVWVLDSGLNGVSFEPANRPPKSLWAEASELNEYSPEQGQSCVTVEFGDNPTKSVILDMAQVSAALALFKHSETFKTKIPVTLDWQGRSAKTIVHTAGGHRLHSETKARVPFPSLSGVLNTIEDIAARRFMDASKLDVTSDPALHPHFQRELLAALVELGTSEEVSISIGGSTISLGRSDALSALAQVVTEITAVLKAYPASTITLLTDLADLGVLRYGLPDGLQQRLLTCSTEQRVRALHAHLQTGDIETLLTNVDEQWQLALPIIVVEESSSRPFPDYRLFLIGDESSLKLPRRSLLLGRGLDADIRIEDAAVSTAHAQLTPPESPSDRWQVTDLGSANGTFVADTKIGPQQPILLDAGHELRLGLFGPRFFMKTEPVSKRHDEGTT